MLIRDRTRVPAAAAVVVAVLAASWIAAAPASAGVTLGHPGTSPGGGQSCGGARTYFQIQGASANYVAPHGGVLTSWRVAFAHNGLKLKVGRPVVGGVAIFAEDGPRSPSSGGGSFAIRIPVQQGDVIGAYMPNTTYCGVWYSGNPTDKLGAVSGDPAIGATAAITESTTPVTASNHVPVEAKLEPDADGDGYGDETQDLCPTDASNPGGPCPPDVFAPDTSITRGPGKKTKSKKATFVFSSSEPGSTFECSLDGGDFAPCTSPATINVRKTGKHNFLVRARDAAGNADPSEARWSWKRVKKRKGK